MYPDKQAEVKLVLDPSKLFGFRNVARVTTPDSDVAKSADLAFTKRGTEFVA